MNKPNANPNLWNHWRLTMALDDVAGGLPTDRRMIEAWQQGRWRAAKLQPGDPADVQEAVERTTELLSGIDEEVGWKTFPRDDQGLLCVEGRQVKAMLKEAANIMKGGLPQNGKVIPLRSRLAEQVFVVERLLPLLPHRTEADETTERAIHVMTARGPRNALSRTDTCHKVEVVCTLRVLAISGSIFTKELLTQLLDYAQENGFGADRSQGLGRFTYTLE